MESYHILSRHILLKTGNSFNRNTRELNCLLYFKGSAQLTHFSPAEHKLFRAVSWSAI